MEVPGLCTACGKPGVLNTCHACGAHVHAQCLTRGLHAHPGPGGHGGRLPPAAR